MSVNAYFRCHLDQDEGLKSTRPMDARLNENAGMLVQYMEKLLHAHEAPQCACIVQRTIKTVWLTTTPVPPPPIVPLQPPPSSLPVTPSPADRVPALVPPKAKKGGFGGVITCTGTGYSKRDLLGVGPWKEWVRRAVGLPPCYDLGLDAKLKL